MKNRFGLLPVICITLSMIMVVAACSRSENSEGGKASPAGKSAEDKSAQAAAPVKKDIHVLLSHTNKIFATRATEAEKKIYYDELNKLSGHNVTFEFLGHDTDFRQQLALHFASGDLGDLVMTSSIDWDVHEGAVDQGVFLELGPLIDKYGPNLKAKIPQVAWNSPKVTKNGKIYGIPYLTMVDADRIMFIRQDWLDKLHMDVPKTLDDFLKFAEEVKVRDMNGDGDPNNEYALSLTDNMAWNDVFTGSFGVRPGTWHMHNGRLEPDIIQPEMKEAIQFYKLMYDKGYIQKDFITKKQGDRQAEVFKGYLGALGAAVYQYQSWTLPSNFVGQPDARITMMVPPKGPRGDNYLSLESDQIAYVWVIPSNTKNPEEVIKYLDWAWSNPDADKFFLYGIEGHNYKVVNGQIQMDLESPENANDAPRFFRESVNPRGIDTNNLNVVRLQQNSDAVIKGYEDSRTTVIKNDGLYLPELQALKGHPELSIGFVSGSLFYDTFVKLVVGKEPVDSGFEKFVQQWKSRGGEAAIQEATKWYQSHNK